MSGSQVRRPLWLIGLYVGSSVVTLVLGVLDDVWVLRRWNLIYSLLALVLVAQTAWNVRVDRTRCNKVAFASAVVSWVPGVLMTETDHFVSGPTNSSDAGAALFVLAAFLTLVALVTTFRRPRPRPLMKSDE